MHAFPAMRLRLKAILLESAQPGSGYTGAPLELCEVDAFKRKRLALSFFHFVYGLCYYVYTQVIANMFIHMSPS